MPVKMNQLVNWGGIVATPRQMLDSGKAEVRVVANFRATSRGKPRRAVFVDRKGTMTGVEVSGYAARS
jgi:hypothetical protein